MNTIQLNGTPHKIRFNFNALRDFKTITGESALTVNLDMESIFILAYVGMKEARRIECKADSKENDFKLELEDLGEMLALSDSAKVTEIFIESFQTEKPKK